MKPRITLHIGRNKAGSTTIQDACLLSRSALLDQGINYVLFGHLSGSRADVPGFATFEALRAQAFADPGMTLLVSNEFMFGWPDAFTEAAARVLADCEVRILAYIRRYDHWIVSAYAEETRKGMNLRDIDAYLGWMEPRVSAWPHLAAWGEGFGWDALRVRDMGAGGLWGADLLADFAHALQVAPLDTPTPPSNVSPHWLEIELVRRLTQRNGDTEWAGVGHHVAEPLIAALRPLIGEAAPTVYLRPEDRRRLRQGYHTDLGRIEHAGGRSLPRPQPESDPPRGTAPSFADAPPDLVRAFLDHVGHPSFASAHPEAAARLRQVSWNGFSAPA